MKGKGEVEFGHQPCLSFFGCLFFACAGYEMGEKKWAPFSFEAGEVPAQKAFSFGKFDPSPPFKEITH